MEPKNKITLTPEQDAWLRENFATVLNCKLADELGVSLRTVVRMARARGLVKDMSAIEGERIEKARKALKHAYATKKIQLHPENGIAARFKPGYKARELFGEEKLAEMRRKGAETRKRTFAEERARATFGLPRRTRLRVVRQPRQKILDRCYLKRRGYIIDNANNVAYWTDETRRATFLESLPKRYFSFAPHPAEDGNETI